MEEEIAKYDERSELATISENDVVEFLNNFGFKTIPEHEKKQFIKICVMNKLNPFKREAYISAYGQGNYRQFAIITGYEVYVKRANSTGLLDGWNVVTKPCQTAKVADNGIVSFVDDLEAEITIRRKDFSSPYIHSVKYSEYVQTVKDKTTGTLRVNKFWKKAETMLKKVATAQGFRLCFPDIFDGLLHIDGEIQNTDYVDISEKQKVPVVNNPVLTEKPTPQQQPTPKPTPKQKETFDSKHKGWNPSVQNIKSGEKEIEASIKGLKSHFDFSEENEKLFRSEIAKVEEKTAVVVDSEVWKQYIAKCVSEEITIEKAITELKTKFIVSKEQSKDFANEIMDTMMNAKS